MENWAIYEYSKAKSLNKHPFSKCILFNLRD